MNNSPGNNYIDEELYDDRSIVEYYLNMSEIENPKSAQEEIINLLNSNDLINVDFMIYSVLPLLKKINLKIPKVDAIKALFRPGLLQKDDVSSLVDVILSTNSHDEYVDEIEAIYAFWVIKS